MENHSPSIYGMTLRIVPGLCYGVLSGLDETGSPDAWQVQSSRIVSFLRSRNRKGLWFKQQPDLFSSQRFPFEQRFLDSFHPCTPMI